MQSRSVARELALLMLGQVSDRQPSADTSLDTLLQQALASLSQHVREALDQAATELQAAQQQLLLSSLQLSRCLIEGLTHVLAQGSQGLLQQGVEGGVGAGLTVTDLTQHQQGQFAGYGAALHQALLEGRGE